MSSSEHICAACPRAVGRSCCEAEGEHELATLSGGDIARIRDATGKHARSFVDREFFTPLEAHDHAQVRPANARAVIRGVRQHLRLVEGACVFHRAGSGCTLSTEVRPLLCRLYPFELDEFSQLRLTPAGRCHAEESLEGMAEVLSAMGLTEASVASLHAQLVQELEDDARSAGE